MYLLSTGGFQSVIGLGMNYQRRDLCNKLPISDVQFASEIRLADTQVELVSSHNNTHDVAYWVGTAGRIYWLTNDWVVILHPIRHKISHFGDVFPSQSLGLVCKPNTSKERIHQSKDIYYNTK